MSGFRIDRETHTNLASRAFRNYRHRRMQNWRMLCLNEGKVVCLFWVLSAQQQGEQWVEGEGGGAFIIQFTENFVVRPHYSN